MDSTILDNTGLHGFGVKTRQERILPYCYSSFSTRIPNYVQDQVALHSVHSLYTPTHDPILQSCLQGRGMQVHSPDEIQGALCNKYNSAISHWIALTGQKWLEIGTFPSSFAPSTCEAR